MDMHIFSKLLDIQGKMWTKIAGHMILEFKVIWPRDNSLGLSGFKLVAGCPLKLHGNVKLMYGHAVN